MNAKEIKSVKKAIDREYNHMKKAQIIFGVESEEFRLARRGYVILDMLAQDLEVDYIPQNFLNT